LASPSPTTTRSSRPIVWDEQAEARQSAPMLTSTVVARAMVCRVDTGMLGGFLHLRACGSMECAAVGWLADGLVVEVVSPPGEWVQVSTPVGVGYVNSSYCKEGEK
jgi:hypothetical protein